MSRFWRRPTRTLVAATLAAVIAIAYLGPSSATAGTAGTKANPNLSPITIGFISQELELVSYVEGRLASQAAVKYINSELGGIDGHPLQLKVCEAGDTPETTVACAQQFINDPSIKLVIVVSDNDTPAYTILNKAGIATLGTAFAANDWTYKNVYSFDLGLGVLAVPILEASLQHVNRMVIACTNDPGYTPLCDVMQKLGQEHGIKMAKQILIDPNEADFTGTVAELQADKGDAIYALTYPTQCLPLANSLKAANVNVKVFTFDVCVNKQSVGASAYNGWYFQFSSRLSQTVSRSSTVVAAQRILAKYGSKDTSQFGFASLAMVSTLSARDMFVAAGGAKATRTDVAKAAAGYHHSYGFYPPISCPGPAPFIGACVTSALELRQQGKQIVPVGGYETPDLAPFKAFLTK